jgi:polyisoprenoid-binding protein YceI
MKRTLLVLSAVLTLGALPSTSIAQAATWRIDPTHSELTFRIRHYVTRVRGTFAKWSGTVLADPANLAGGSVDVLIDAKSIDTNQEMRDNDLRSNNFFATDSFPNLSFKSTKVETSGKDLRVYGDLTIRGITRPVVLTGSYSGLAKDAQGRERIGFEASTRINRLDYKVTWNRAIEGGGLMLGDDVDIDITIEAVRT